MKKFLISIVFFILLSGCAKKIECAPSTLNYIRLEKIYVDCRGNTYGECIIKYDNALKKSNEDKDSLLKDIKIR